MSYYKSWHGLTKLSANARGHETLGVGIRPYGLHAGNLASVVAYPYLFLEDFEKRHQKKPCFNFQVWLNDIEPTVYVGADGKRQSADWANMYPGSTSFQLTPVPNGFKGNLADYWQPAIEGVVRGVIGTRFPDVVLEFRRASELVVTPEFEKTVVGCIKDAGLVENFINRWNRGVAKVNGAASFVWPLSPESHDPVMYPKLEQVDDANLITALHASTQHNVINQKPVEELLWAVQFRMLHVARLAAIKPDIWFMGMDHVPTNMGNLLSELAALFCINRYGGHFLHAPLLFADGNKKISKSLGGAAYISVNVLIDMLRENPNTGLDVKDAPVSSDILSIGSHLLPSHIAGDDQLRRMKIIEQEKDDYESWGKSEVFRSANAAGTITNDTVARMLGVPHL